ncbi:MAG: GPR endopeptidase [Oscillospiraceae bacterium]
MSNRTDLAVECLDFATEMMPKGVEKTVETKNGLNVTRVKITDEQSARVIGKPIGEYITIDTSDFKAPSDGFNNEVETIAEILSTIINKDERGVLVVGLGNQEITPDALGPKTISYTFATRHIDGELQQQIGLPGLTPVAAIATGVLGQTGIETAEIVAALTKSINPSCVIVIDALASKSVDRLATTIQISNAGIAPGSGVQNKRKELSEKTLGVPVVSIGVPMVVDMTTIAYDMLGEGISDKVSEKGKTMMVTPREIDLAIEHASKMVAFAINKALQPTLSLEDLYALVG